MNVQYKIINVMKTKRVTKKSKKEEAYGLVKKSLKHLTFDELEDVIAWAERYRKEKLGAEELLLIKKKEELELQLKNLKEQDKKINSF